MLTLDLFVIKVNKSKDFSVGLAKWRNYCYARSTGDSHLLPFVQQGHSKCRPTNLEQL